MIIRTYNQIDPLGLDIIQRNSLEIESGEASKGSPNGKVVGMLLRSHKLKEKEIPSSVIAIGRAGSGVNNIPLDYCTHNGIVVFNAPGANANAVVELALGSAIAFTRNFEHAIKFSHELDEDAQDLNQMVESGKKAFKGSELRNKTMGIIGVGAIGSVLAQVCLDLGMHVYGYDPYISVTHALRVPRHVHWCAKLEDLLKKCDIVSLHLPMTEETVNLISGKQFKLMKEGSILLNLARDGLVNEKDLLTALDEKFIGGYITDFPTPDLLRRMKSNKDTLVLPHLGASTKEAETNCATMVAEQLVSILRLGNVRNSVNYPYIEEALDTQYRLTIANKNTAGTLGTITDRVGQSNINVENLVNKSKGDVAWTLLDFNNPPDDQLIQDLENLDTVLRVRTIDQEAIS